MVRDQKDRAHLELQTLHLVVVFLVERIGVGELQGPIGEFHDKARPPLYRRLPKLNLLS
jgi:hypothetical protein